MMDAYKIGIAINLTNNISTAMGLMIRHFNMADASAKRLSKSIERIKLAAGVAAISATMSAAIGAPIIAAISDAARLQKEMIGIGIATRGSTREMSNMRKVIETTSGSTMFSSIDVAQMAKQLATGTGWSAAQVSADLPIFAQFADAQKLMKGTGQAESIKTGIQLSHLAGYSSPEDISKYLDTLTRASMVVPGGLGEVAHALKYSQAIAKNVLGMSDQTTVEMVTALNRMGLGGSRGGTTLIASLTRSIPGIFGSGLLTGKSGEAAKAMGMADAKGNSTVFTNGKFDPIKWIATLAAYQAKEYASNPEAIARQNIMKNLQHLLGVNGAKGAALMASPAAATALASVQKAMAEGQGTAAIQKIFADTSVYQKWENAQTNFKTLITEMGYTLLPLATVALTKLNTALSWLTDMVRKHPNMTKWALEVGLATSAVLALVAGIGLITIPFMALGAIMPAAATAIGAATAAVTAFIGVMGAAAAVGGVIGYQGGKAWAEHDPEGFKRFHAAMDHLLPAGLQAPLNGGNSAVIKPSGAGGINVTANLNVDGKKMATTVLRNLGKSGDTPAQSGDQFDPRRMQFQYQ